MSTATAPAPLAGTRRRCWRVYVGSPDRDFIHLDQGALTWAQAHDLLTQWVKLYEDDDRQRQARDAYAMLELLSSHELVGTSLIGSIAGEIHAIIRDTGRSENLSDSRS